MQLVAHGEIVIEENESLLFFDCLKGVKSAKVVDKCVPCKHRLVVVPFGKDGVDVIEVFRAIMLSIGLCDIIFLDFSGFVQSAVAVP